MNAVRKRKLGLIFFFAAILCAVTSLILYALRENISLFYSPSQIIKGEAAGKKSIRLGGMVVKGSIIRSKEDLSVQFQLTDFNENITVNYRGVLPDLFREEQGIVAEGELIDLHHFRAKEVLAKHDANYMPPELKAALTKKDNHENKLK